MSQADKKESLITNVREIKQEIKTLIVDEIKTQQIEIVSISDLDIQISVYNKNGYVYQTLPVIIDINAYRIIFDINYGFDPVNNTIEDLYITFNPGTNKALKYFYTDNSKKCILKYTNCYIIPALLIAKKKQTAAHHESTAVSCVKAIMQREMAILAGNDEYTVKVSPITTDPVYNGSQVVTIYDNYTISCLVYLTDVIQRVYIEIEHPSKNKKYFEDIPFIHMDYLTYCIKQVLIQNLIA